MKKLLNCFNVLCGLPLSILLLVVLTPVVSAQPTVVPDLTVRAPGLGVALSVRPDPAAFTRDPNGRSWDLTTPFNVPGAPWLTVRELRFDTDPTVYASYLVQNITGAPQNYTVGVSLPSTWSAPNLIRGSVDTSVIGTDGQVSALANSSIYSAQIDAITVRTLQGYPFTLSTPQNAVSASAAFGFDPNNIAVNSSIGILLNFQLSPGDYAAIISDFEVAAVPEPGSLVLLLLGGVVLIWRRQVSV